MSESTPIASLSRLLRAESSVQRFHDVLDGRPDGYITSVILAVKDNPDLWGCDFDSIMASALRAATLKLTCDPGLGYAYLVPYGNKCTLIVGARGLYQMAIRTGRYEYINTHAFKEGGHCTISPLSGWVEDYELGNRNGNNIGWLSTFSMNQQYGGLKKAVYWTVEEIANHASEFSPGFRSKNQKNPWHKSEHTRAAMEEKTVLRHLLTRYGYLDPNDQANLVSVDELEPNGAEEVLELVPLDPAEEEKKSPEQLITEITGKEPEED